MTVALILLLILAVLTVGALLERSRELDDVLDVLLPDHPRDDDKDRP